jgi:hypothetical protein
MSMLNGWRRIGVVILLLWLIGITGITVFEFVNRTHVFFSRQDIPNGTKIEGNNVTLPDGKVVTVRVPRDLLTGQLAKPWEMDWSLYPEIPKKTVIQWNALGIAIVIPIVLWIIIELLVIAIGWIKCGFKESSKSS